MLPASQVHRELDTQEGSDLSQRILYFQEQRCLTVHACSCGWWSSLNEMTRLEEYPEIGDNSFNEDPQFAILRSFSPSDVDAPLEALIRYLARHHSDLRHLNPTKLEHLVGAVFRDHCCCEVRHCGRTGDGGVDLFVLDSDSPLLVQVKRRSTSRAEPVETVRHLLGAVLLMGHCRAAVVTTAPRFSSPAIKAAEQAVTKDLLREFALLDFGSFAEILRLVARNQEPPWKRALAVSDWRNKRIM